MRYHGSLSSDTMMPFDDHRKVNGGDYVFLSKKTAAVTKALNDREVCEMPYRVCQQVYARNWIANCMVADSLEESVRLEREYAKLFNKTA